MSIIMNLSGPDHDFTVESGREDLEDSVHDCLDQLETKLLDLPDYNNCLDLKIERCGDPGEYTLKAVWHDGSWEPLGKTTIEEVI